jgi:hypothetical protein
LWEALQALDARPSEHGDLGGNWSLETRRGRLDVMQWVAGVEDYEELRARAVTDELPEIGRPIWIAGRDDLVTMKEAGLRNRGPNTKRRALCCSGACGYGLGLAPDGTHLRRPFEPGCRLEPLEGRAGFGEERFGFVGAVLGG